MGWIEFGGGLPSGSNSCLGEQPLTLIPLLPGVAIRGAPGLGCECDLGIRRKLRSIGEWLRVSHFSPVPTPARKPCYLVP